MSGLSYPHPESDELPTSIGTPHSPSQGFHNPFSDLNLFLSTQIKREIEKQGSTTQWSGKIEADLLSKILPEFKQKFPKYSLGASSLKKVWEKVSHYYEKIYKQKGALHSNGKLNLKFMIRESLKSCTDAPSSPPYSYAQELASKLCEYIATIEGKRPEFLQLTKVIWAVQKHLLKNLSVLNAKSPFEEYDQTDKLIVKTLLEVNASEEALDIGSLRRKVSKELTAYAGVKTLIKRSELTSTLSMVLAQKLYSTSLIDFSFSIKEKKSIETFIRYQIGLSENNQTLTNDSHHVELIQRILALYEITQELPRNLDESFLRKTIQHVQTHLSDKNCRFTEEMDKALFVFINAEMHLMDEHKSFVDLEALESTIVQAYHQALKLPPLSSKQKELFELLTWKVVEETGNLLDDIPLDTLKLLQREVGNTVIDAPHQPFRRLLGNALQFFKKVQGLDFTSKFLEEKIEVWATQNDMLIRFVHFDPQTPFVKMLKDLWGKTNPNESNVNHETFIKHTLKHALQVFPLLLPFEDELRTRLWILYKHLWYTTFTDGCQSTYENFLMWHRVQLSHHYPDWSSEKVEESLQKLSKELIPLAPFEQAG